MKPISKIEELKLIAKCVAKDDRDAFGKLVEAYQYPLRQFLLNLTLNNTDLADDLAQETFIKAYLAIKSFKGVSMFKTWLYRIAYNEFYSYCRSQKEKLQIDDLKVVETIDTVSEYDARMDIESMLKTLTVNQRTAVLLFYLQGYKIKDVAKIMNCPENSVKTLLLRAKQKMKLSDK